MIDQGADVLYAERFGVSDAAKERGVKAIGNVIDTQEQYPGTVVASALWHMEPSIDKALAAVKGGSVRGRGLRAVEQPAPSAAARWRRSSAELVPADVIELVRRKRGGDHERAPQGRGRRQRAQVDQVSRAGASEPAPVVLRLEGITKRFGEPRRQRRASTSSCAGARSWRSWARTAPARPR